MTIANIRFEDLTIVGTTNVEESIVVDTYKKTVNKRVVINAYSTIEKPIVVVRNICESNINLKRAALVKLCQEAGVNINTAKTQVQRFLKRNKTLSITYNPAV